MFGTPCAPVTEREVERYNRLNDLKDLFDGKSIVDIDGKGRRGDFAIEKSYGRSDEAGGQLFNEIVWRSTYKPTEAYASFTNGDFRRIANEIQKESSRLNNPKLSFLEKYGFVRRGVMRKYAVTNLFNKEINEVTNYERTKYTSFTLRNREVSALLRLEAIKRGDQSKTFMGIKAEKDLEILERKLAQQLTLSAEARKNNKNIIESDAKADMIRNEIVEHLKTKGGQVLKEFVEYMETPKLEGALVVNQRTGERFSSNIVKAGEAARSMLNEMGGVFIVGLNKHKQVINQAFLNKRSPSKLDNLTPLGKRLRDYRRNIDDQINSIKEGISTGDYFPHFVMESMLMLESKVEQIDKLNNESTKREWSEREASKHLEELESIFSTMRDNLNRSPAETRQRKKQAYDNYLQNPLAVLRKYGNDAIAFNKNQHLKDSYMKALKSMPKDGEAAEAMRKYVTETYQLADKGFTERPGWVNKAVRTITGIEFLSKIGFGIGTAVRNTMSGVYYIQGLGNRKFAEYSREWVSPKNKKIREEVSKIEEEQGFLFRDLAEELYTEGMIPTKGVRSSEVDMKLDEATGKMRFSYKEGNSWKAFDSGLSWATGKGAILQRVTENMLRKHMFRSAYMIKRNELTDMGVPDAKGKNISRKFALDLVNKYAFEYAAHQKAPIAGGSKSNLGAVGQVAFQFMHYPMSFLQQQSEILRNSSDAIKARQWNNPDTTIPIKYGAVYLLTHLLSGVFNRDLHRLMENDTIDRLKNVYDVLNGEEDIMGRGYMGPAVGDLFFYATLYDLIDLPEDEFVNLIVGYNDAGRLTDEQKTNRIWSSLNVELSKWVNKNIPLIRSGKTGSILMHELGLYPRSWTKELHKKIFGKSSSLNKKSSKKKDKFVPSYLKAGTKTEKKTYSALPKKSRNILKSLDKARKSAPIDKYDKFNRNNLLAAMDMIEKQAEEEKEIYTSKNNRRMIMT